MKIRPLHTFAFFILTFCLGRASALQDDYVGWILMGLFFSTLSMATSALLNLYRLEKIAGKIQKTLTKL